MNVGLMGERMRSMYHSVSKLLLSGLNEFLSFKEYILMSTDELCSLMQTERNEIAQNRSYDGESIKSFVTNVHSILCIFSQCQSIVRLQACASELHVQLYPSVSFRTYFYLFPHIEIKYMNMSGRSTQLKKKSGNRTFFCSSN